MEKYLNLVYSLALKYKNDFVDFDDLIQEGYIGLYKAYKNYKTDKNVSFSTYAYFWIKKYIIAFLNKQKKENFLSFDEVDVEKISYFEEISEDKTDIKEKISNLNLDDLELKVISLNFKQKLPLDKIAKILNLPRERIRQIKSKALRKLKINTKLTESL